MKFDTTVCGIPCECRVVYYRPYIPAKVDGPPENCYPEEASEFEFELIIDGNPAIDLEDRMTNDDMQQLQDEYEAIVTANKHGINY